MSDNVTAPTMLAVLREFFSYDPDAGRFTKIKKLSALYGNSPDPAKQRISGYRQIRLFGFWFQEHRLAWLWTHGEWPKGEIDHINGDPSDNRIVNLRVCTRSENARNVGKTAANTSGYKGVSYRKNHDNWGATISKEGKRYHLGYFPTPELAHAAYGKAAKQLFGEFARTE